MADSLEKCGTFLKERRAKLWRRCANMTEILAKEETEATLWQNRYREAIAVVAGNCAFFWCQYGCTWYKETYIGGYQERASSFCAKRQKEARHEDEAVHEKVTGHVNEASHENEAGWREIVPTPHAEKVNDEWRTVILVTFCKLFQEFV